MPENNPMKHKAHADLAHHDLMETVNRLIAEGMDWRVVLAALGACTADLVVSKMGLQAVPQWFFKQGKMLQDEIDK